MNRKLVLEDGQEYIGIGFGSEQEKVVEVVFNTSMVGYQEILSDPSYTDQAVVMTYPLIGNYGMCRDDYETKVPSISGMIVHEYNPEPSNFRSEETLDFVMKKYGIVGLSGIDTRKLARHIRDKGTCKGLITDEQTTHERAIQILKNTELPTDQIAKVSTKEIWESKVEAPKYKVAVIDCGIKYNIIRSLNKLGCDVTVLPWNTQKEKILPLKPDGLFISNGPGDPENATPTVELVKSLHGVLPIFGICMGHQIIALSYGAKTYKLKFGHRGGNHPVKNLLNGKVEITSQNHSYAVDEKSLKNTGLEVTHINLLDKTVEGLENEKDKVFSVQYHPESAPGPQDSAYLFKKFIDMMEGEKDA